VCVYVLTKTIDYLSTNFKFLSPSLVYRHSFRMLSKLIPLKPRHLYRHFHCQSYRASNFYICEPKKQLINEKLYKYLINSLINVICEKKFFLRCCDLASIMI
jgi:hypothetical protein